MPDFRALARQAMTVEFHGETVALRPCPYESRKRINDMVAAGQEDDLAARVDNYHRAVAAALEATVVGADLSQDEWLDLLSAEAALPDLANLAVAAMRCSGMQASVQTGNDNVDAADQTLGN